MRILLKGLITASIALGMVSWASGYPNPVEGGALVTVTNDWDAGYQLTVGGATSGNTLSMTNGGSVFADNSVIGDSTGSDGNSVIVGGTGAVWNTQADLIVGNHGSSNTMMILDGGTASNANSDIGKEEDSSFNQVIVDGSNSVWNISDTLIVGRKGDSNLLTVSGGATVNSRLSLIGFETPAVSNGVVVSGDGSIWNNSEDLVIGAELNSNNYLTVENGGKVVVGGRLRIDEESDLNLNDGGWLRIDGVASLGSDRFHYNAGSTLEVTGTVAFNGEVSDRNTLIFQGENATWVGGSIQDLEVGVAGNDNLVIISNQASITAFETIMDNDNNTILVTGSGSRFDTVTNLTVGVGGVGNELRVEEGGTASSVTGYVGYASSADNNRIVVDGTGSSYLNDGAVFIGYDGGMSNRIDVVNGGLADLGATYIGFTNATYSSMLVDGEGSAVSATDFVIGEESQYNSVAVLNGGSLVSTITTIGSGTNGHNNAALVSGTNSFWDAGSMSIGVETNLNNTLTIEDGGQVFVSELTIAASNSTGNALYLNEGGWLTVGPTIMDGEMLGFHWGARSTLEIQGSITNLNGIVDGTNTLIFSNGGTWTNSGSVAVGFNNSSNQLKLVDGGTIDKGSAYIGQQFGSDFNRVEINGSASIWEAGSFSIGEAGSDNSLLITNGGALIAWGNAEVGVQSGSDRNGVVIDGSGSSLHSISSLVVGDDGSSNTLQVSNGGYAGSSSAGILGYNSDGNAVLVDGNGSSWYNGGSLYVGYNGSGNTLTASNGAWVDAGINMYIGFAASGQTNALTVSGENSLLSVEEVAYVGFRSSDNELSILNGATVMDQIGMVGSDNGADNNQVLIEGADSLWFNSSRFIAGNSGSGNVVTIRDGALLFSSAGYIGDHTNAIGNQVIVDNAVWLSTNSLFVGFNGSSNNMVVINGALVASGESRIGAEESANNNSVHVTGDDSLWYVGNTLWIGNDTGTNNTLVVDDGGTVVVEEDISVSPNNNLYVNAGGTLTVYGDTIFTDGFNVDAGGTFESFGGVSGIGDTLNDGRTLRLIGENASWSETGDILLETGSFLDIGAGATVSTPSNFTQQAAATIQFGVSTNNVGGPLFGSIEVGLVADFATGANLFYNSEIGGLSWDETYTNTLISAGTLVVGGQTNATTADVVNHLNIAAPSLLDISLFTEDQSILAIVNRLRLSDALGADSEDFRSLLEEIEDRAIAGDPLAIRQMDIINSLSRAQALAETSQFYTRGIPTYQHVDGLVQGLRQIRQRTSEELMKTAYYIKPSGAYGPSTVANGEWRGWVSAYGHKGSRDASGHFSEYDLSTYGTMIGVDRSFNNAVVGISGGTAGSTIDQEDGDTSDASTAYGAIYATVRANTIDWDFMASYGNSSIENSSGTIFGSDAETDASTMVFYIGAREEAATGAFSYEPVVALQVAGYSQDGYDEESSNAIGRAVDAFDHWSYKSILGLTAGNVTSWDGFDLITRIRAHWQHEFNTDVDDLRYTLIGGSEPHSFTMQTPVQDSVDLGISFGVLFNENLEVGVGIDGLYSEDYTAVSYNGSLQFTF